MSKKAWKKSKLFPKGGRRIYRVSRGTLMTAQSKKIPCPEIIVAHDREEAMQKLARVAPALFVLNPAEGQ